MTFTEIVDRKIELKKQHIESLQREIQHLEEVEEVDDTHCEVGWMGRLSAG